MLDQPFLHLFKRTLAGIACVQCLGSLGYRLIDGTGIVGFRPLAAPTVACLVALPLKTLRPTDHISHRTKVTTHASYPLALVLTRRFLVRLTVVEALGIEPRSNRPTRATPYFYKRSYSGSGHYAPLLVGPIVETISPPASPPQYNLHPGKVAYRGKLYRDFFAQCRDMPCTPED